MTDAPTRWDLSNIFPGLDSPQFTQAFQQIPEQIAAVTTYFNENLMSLKDNVSAEKLNQNIGVYLDQLNNAIEHAGKIANYLYSFISTDSFNKNAQKLFSQFEQMAVELEKQDVVFKGWLKQFSGRLDQITNLGGTASSHAFNLQESVEQSQYMMSQAEEALASDLNLSGGMAWEQAIIII